MPYGAIDYRLVGTVSNASNILGNIYYMIVLAGFISNSLFPKLLTVGPSSGLPSEIARFHTNQDSLARINMRW